MISNCGTPTEKVPEFLYSEIKSVMREGWSYIKNSGNFIKKLKNIVHISQDAMMVTADVVGLYLVSLMMLVRRLEEKRFIIEKIKRFQLITLPKWLNLF